MSEPPSSEPGPVRWFFALPVSDAVRSAAAALSDEARAHAPRARFVDPARYHLTVRFLGDVEPALRAPLVDAARAALVDTEPFSLRFGRAETFGRPARVLWWGPVEGEEGFERLARSLDEALAELGLPARDLEARTHLTLARARGRGDRALARAARALGEKAGPALSVDSAQLLASQPTERGPTYREVGRFPLRGL